MAHKYGGPWSELKLDAVEYYLKCYTKALTAARMDLWYIDAFAGSGDREVERQVGGLLDGREVETLVETLDGSARRGLKVQPPFRHFIFIEKDPERAAALESVRAEWPQTEISVRRGDSNAELLDIISREPWTKRSKSRSRGVVFLDPFAMQVEWSTLQALSQTQCLDIWYLFNVAAVTRQLAHDWSGIGNKEAALDRVLSARWRELYTIQPVDEIPQDLFGAAEGRESVAPTTKRTVSKSQIDKWFKGLLEGEFAFVSDPLPITKDFVGYVNRKYGPLASRRRSSR